MAYVYVLYSRKIDKFYIGSCLAIEQRLIDHNSSKYETSFTARSNDWQVFLSIDDLEYEKARMIELHIKKMKSKKYLLNLKAYPEMATKLRNRFSYVGSFR